MRTMMSVAALALVVGLAAPAYGQDQDRARAEAKLRNMKVTLDFQNSPLPTVIDYLREISGLNLFIDHAVVEMEITITMKVQEISLKSVLSLMLAPQGCEAIYHEGVIQVMRSEDVRDRTLVLELYDVRDILHPIKDFPGVDISLSTEMIGTTIDMQDFGDSRESFPIEELIRAHCGDGEWDDGSTSVSLQNGILMVRHRPKVHREVTRLLNLLRANK